MSLRIVLPRLVERDLAEVADFIGKSDHTAGLRFLSAAKNTLATLAQMPGMGALWESDDERLHDIRVWRIRGFKKYLIFYRTYANRLEIVRILHGARDIEEIIKDT